MRFFAFIAGLLVSSGAAIAAPEHTNLVFILTDNQPASILGAYGNPDVRTPNIDALAKEGMRFERAFAANGMCSATRATLMTGLMPSQHGVHNWLDDALLDEWPEGWSAIAEFRTLPQTLADHGYRTAMIGKWHLGQPWKATAGFGEWITFSDGHTVDFWNNTIVENDERYVLSDVHTVDFFADKAVGFIQRQTGETPFYLQLNLNGPYLNPPSNVGPARNRYYKDYLNSNFSSFPRVAVNSNIVDQLLDKDTPAFLIEKHRQSIAAHNDHESMANAASQNTLVDNAIGRVLTALQQSGLNNSTLVVMSTDQGNFYGQHGLWQHTVVTSPSNLYEAALNIPLIVRHTGHIKPATVSSALIAQYDIPDTILDYLGITEVEFANSPGRSFAPLLLGNSMDKSRDAVFYEQEESRGIRTDQFALWQRLPGTGSTELYDMIADPGQLQNLADQPAYTDTIRTLTEKLNQFFDTYSEPRYDLWKGGVAKGSIVRPGLFRKLYGEDWKPVTDLAEPFTE